MKMRTNSHGPWTASLPSTAAAATMGRHHALKSPPPSLCPRPGPSNGKIIAAPLDAAYLWRLAGRRALWSGPVSVPGTRSRSASGHHSTPTRLYSTASTPSTLLERSYTPREETNGHNNSLSPSQGRGRGRIRCDIRSIPHPTSAAAGSWSEVCIENAGRLNSLNTELLQGLCLVFRQLALREDLRCVVITGAEDVSLSTSTPPTNKAPPKPKTPAFCAGADIHEMSALDSSSGASKFITAVHDACQAVRETPVVTVASIHGLTFGAGLELAASCDFRYASRASLFSMPEVILGIPSVVQARLLANIVGWQRTKTLVYLGHQIDASTAESWGLVDRVFESRGALEDGVWGMVKTVAANGPRAMRAQKLLVQRWEESDLSTGVEAGIEAFADMWRDGGVEPMQYMRPFLERRAVKR